jgi:uncharacterized membrane protein
MDEQTEVIEDIAEIEQEELSTDELEQDPGDSIDTEAQDEPATTEEPGELVVTLGDEELPGEQANEAEWLKNLRKKYRDATKELREIKAKAQTAAPETPKLGQKPTLEACDYDADEFERKLSDYYDQKRKVDDAQDQERKAHEALQQEWKAKQSAYEAKKQSLNVPDFDDAEDEVVRSLSTAQQSIIVKTASDPAMVVLALGKNPASLAKLSKVTDLAQFAYELGVLESSKMKVTQRSPSVTPEKTVKGTGPVSGSVSASNLENLRNSAQKSGNWDPYFAHKRAITKK